jgi:hypothetical protein
VEEKPGVVVHICNPRFRSQRQEDQEFEASLSYRRRPCLKKKETETEEQKTKQKKKWRKVRIMEFTGEELIPLHHQKQAVRHLSNPGI